MTIGKCIWYAVCLWNSFPDFVQKLLLLLSTGKNCVSGTVEAFIFENWEVRCFLIPPHPRIFDASLIHERHQNYAWHKIFRHIFRTSSTRFHSRFIRQKFTLHMCYLRRNVARGVRHSILLSASLSATMFLIFETMTGILLIYVSANIMISRNIVKIAGASKWWSSFMRKWKVGLIINYTK